MPGKTKIEWTDATWNPVTGCTEISPGCDHCYAKTFAERWRGTKGHHYEQGFDLKVWPKRFNKPLEWKKSRMIFVNSMSDLFHRSIEHRHVVQIFNAMEEANWHIFQVLTKRPQWMKYYNWPAHVWGGTSVESKSYKFRIDRLKDTDIEVRFLSLEPLLEDLGELDLKGIHWVIVGGESGAGARPMDIEWVRNIRDQCLQQCVPFFFKQWGGVNKKKAGRILDGRTHNNMPVMIKRAASRNKENPK